MMADASNHLGKDERFEDQAGPAEIIFDQGTPYRGEVFAEPLAKRLTRQEKECLCWCKEGKTNWEIGEILLISEKTVEFHLGNAMRKLGAANRITAVILGIKRGIIEL
jgi:DNA-binding CsgD family transcriptional regulator